MPLNTVNPLFGRRTLEGTRIAATCHEPHPWKAVKYDIPYETQRSPLSARAVLLLAWSLVLNDYENNDTISFGVQKHVSNQKTIVPFQVELNAQFRIKDALTAVEAAETTLETPSLGALANQFQSILVISEEGTTAFEKDDEVASPNIPITIFGCLHNAGIGIKAVLRSTAQSHQSERMMVHQLVYTVKRILSTDSDAPLADVRGVCSTGLEQILEWNSSSPPCPRKDELVHEHFAAICERQPQAIAINAWNGSLTYGELGHMSTIVALKLARHVQPGNFVCVFMEKSVWVSVAMLAVIKAGCAFILLDHTQPDERLRTICSRSAAAAILCSEQLEQRSIQLGVSSVFRVPLLEDEALWTEDDPATLPPPGALSAASTALFAIFTSGSTGEPKGIVCTHTSWSSGVERKCARTYITRETRVFQAVSHSFIITPINYLTALHSGACICVPSEEQLSNSIAGAIWELGATSAIMTPSMARVMDPQDVSSLQTLMLTGETLTKHDIERWQGLRLLTLYGLSELVVAAAISHKSSVDSDPADIGTAVATRSWVVCPDDHNVLQPVGAPGELLIEGPSLGSGYLNDPEKTNKTYITDPAWCQLISPGAAYGCRFLKSGDIVRYAWPEGTLQYIGRKDTQVKLRGQRMDLPEIEYHVQQWFPDVRQVVAEVVMPANGVLPEHAMLVVFVPVQRQQDGQCVADFILAPKTAEFRQKAQQTISQLKEILPGFMIPTAFVNLEHLPLTASGKLNRRILRESACKMSREELLSCSHEVSDTKTQAATANEAIIQNACAQVLAQPAQTISVKSSFSSLAVDSLSARHIVSICRRQGLVLSVADVFNIGSIQELARTCSSRDTEEYRNTLTDDRFGSLRSDFLSHPPTTLPSGAEIEAVFPTLLAQSRAAKAIDYFVVHLSGAFEQGRFDRACGRLVQAHTALRTVFVYFKGRLLNVVLRSLTPDIQHQSVSPGKDLVCWAREFCIADLEKSYHPHEPVVKFLVGSNADQPESRILIIRLNHAQFDGNCTWQIISDLGLAYAGREIEVSSDFFQFAHQTFQQREQWQASARAYWTNLLTDATITSLPVSPKSQNPDKTATPIFITRSLAVQVPPPQGVSMATVVKAAWSHVLRKNMGTDDVLFAQVINCRDLVILPGAEHVVGACHNFSPVRIRYPSAPQPADSNRLLWDLQEQHIQSLPHALLDWEDIVKNCTSWAVDTMPTFYLAYQDARQFTDQDAGGQSIRWGEHLCDHCPPGEAWLSVTPADGALRIDFGTMSTAMDSETAAKWIADFCQCIMALLEGMSYRYGVD